MVVAADTTVLSLLLALLGFFVAEGATGDSSLSKSQVIINLTIVIICYHYTIHMMSKSKSHEQGLITKKCIAMHTNYFSKFKTALYSSVLVMKLFNNKKCCFKAKLLP